MNLGFTDKSIQQWYKVLKRRNKILILSPLLLVVVLLIYCWPFERRQFIVFKKSTFPANIFLLETSGRSKLNPRQACAVESAARYHWNSVVSVYLVTSDEFDDSFRLTSSLTNIRFIKIDADSLFADSPLWEWYRRGDWRNSSNRIHDISDASRLLLVWKFGGVYLDLDIIVLRSLYGVENSLFKEHKTSIGNSVFGFERHHPFISKCLERFERRYVKGKWGSAGPALVTETFKSECRLSYLKEGSHPQCNLRLLPQVIAYVVDFRDWKDFFEADKKDRVQKLSEYSYLMHFWNYASGNTYVSLNSGTAYEDAVKNECPTVYSSLVRSTQLNRSFVF